MASIFRTCRALALGFLGLLAWEGASAEEGTKRALLIGINDFRYDKVRDLRGTHNDVDAVAGLLVNRYRFAPNDVRILKDSQATYAAIEAAIRDELARVARPEDVVVIYVSSHGSRAPDDNGDEADGWDETLVAHDSRMPGIYDIRDDDFGRWLEELSERTPNVTVILDTCNSGTAARADVTARFIPPDSRLTPPDTLNASSPSRDGLQDALPRGRNFVLLSGSAAEEFSNEDYLDGGIRGVLTHYLVRQLEASPTRTSYRNMFHTVALRVNALFPSQHPQIEGNGLDNTVFGDERANVDATIFVDPVDAEFVTLQAGAIFGVRQGSRVTIYEPGDTPLATAASLAEATVTDVKATTATARLNTPADIPFGARARVGDVLLKQMPVVVFASERVGADVRGALARGLPASIRLAEAGSNPEDAHLMLDRTPAGWVILGRDRATRSTLAGDSDAAAIARRLEGWGRWEAVRELRNPTSQLDISFVVTDYGNPSTTPVARLRSQSLATVKVKNDSDEAVYINVLDLTSLGVIRRILPKDANAELKLEPRGEYSTELLLEVPGGEHRVVDTLLMLASTSPFDATVFEQGRQRADREPGPLDEALLDWARGSRDASVATMDDWTVQSQTVEVTRSGIDRGDVRFAVHTTNGGDSIRSSLESQRGELCGNQDAPGCVSVDPLSANAGVFEVAAPMLRGRRGDSANAPVAVGALFEEAYELRERTGAEYVEPLLTVRNFDRAEDTTTRGGDSETFELAENDPRWSLNYANVPKAWRMLQDAGRLEFREAQGVLLAHIDTGYTLHPEMVDAAHPPVLAARGFNYLNNSNDAKDPRTATGTLKHPGHGTAAGSVIVSPDGCQLPGKTKCATGTGRGAQLVPLRLNESVINFSQAKLSRALFDIAEGKRGNDIQAISLAMGGPPTLSLWKATRAVEKEGILFFAAAGNYVQTVVWPARFDSAIAVSAINPACRPWPHASHGSAVDFSAPGQGVWRATFAGDTPDVGMGAGTTFATGTAAGIGALWLSHHRDSEVLKELRQTGQLTEAFRRLVQQTAWRPDGASKPEGVTCSQRWDRGYGTGIVNAASLLAAPLPRSRALPTESTQPLPLFASLYAESTRASQVRADFDKLLRGPKGDVAPFQTELLYHYAEANDVRQALDRLIAGDRSEATFTEIRAALLAQDISRQLRDRLTPVED